MADSGLGFPIPASPENNPDAAPLPPSKRLHIEEGESTILSSEEESQAGSLQDGTVSSAQEVVTNLSLNQLDQLRRDPTAEPVDNQQESTQPFYSEVACDLEVCDSENVWEAGCGHQARGRSELLTGDEQHPMNRAGAMVGGRQPLSRGEELVGGQSLNRSVEVDGGQPLNRSVEVDGGQPLNGGGVVAQSPAESWLSGCNSMGQMQVDDDDPPSTVIPLPPTDDLTTIQHNIPNTPAVLAALDDCKRGNEMTYPKLVTMKVPIGSEVCAEEGVVQVAIKFPSRYHSLEQLVDQCLANDNVPPNGGFAVVQAVYHLVQWLLGVHNRGYSCYGTIAGLQDLYVGQDTFSSIRHPVTVLCVPDISRLSHDRCSGLDPYSREARVREGRLWDVKALQNIINQVLSMAEGYQIHVSEMLKGNLKDARRRCIAACDGSYMALVHKELEAKKRVCVVQFAPNENYQKDHIVCLEKEKINDVVLKWLLKNSNGVRPSLIDTDHRFIHVDSSEVCRSLHKVAAIYLSEAPPPPLPPPPPPVPQGIAAHLTWTRGQPMSVQTTQVQPGPSKRAKGQQEFLPASSTSQYVPLVAMGRSAAPLNGVFHPSPNPLPATSFSSPHPPRGPATERPLGLSYTARDPQTGISVRTSHTSRAPPIGMPTWMRIQPLLAPHDPSHSPTSKSTTTQAATSSHLNPHPPPRHQW